MKKQITIGVGDAESTAADFVEAWKRAERGEELQVDQRLYFENLETLLKTLSPGRWILLRKLRTSGPMSVRTLAKELDRDYKNVHTDVHRLEMIGLIARTKDNQIEVPWDIVEARLKLAA
jgi:predicted transcriptional regulator